MPDNVCKSQLTLSSKDFNLAFAESSLIESLANAMPQIVWLADPEGNVNFYNQAWYDSTGMSHQQTQMDSWKTAIHPDELEECMVLSRNAIATASPYEAEFRIWHARGNTYKWHLIRALPVRDESGRVARWVGTCTDIDAQKRKEQASEARFRAAIDITNDAICLLDRSSMRFIDCNDTACRMFGYSREELLKIGPSQLGAGSHEILAAIYDEVIAGQDYPTKEAFLLHKNGSHIPVEIQRRAMQAGDMWIMVLVARDITERKEAQARMEQLAYYDQTTGLPNRRMFNESLVNAIVQAKKQRLTISVLLINLDRFKNINDSLGFPTGDELLQQVGKRLINGLRIRDIVGRLGGDDFGLILFNSEHSQGAVNVANKVLDMLRQPFSVNGHEVTVTISMGISVYPADTDDADTMIRFADLAMNESKLAGGNTFRFHTTEMNVRIMEKRALQEALNIALANNEFVLHFQPRIQVETGQWQSVEALLRWKRPGHGLVSPANFIPALEETGLIVPVGEWVIAAACRHIRQWAQEWRAPVRVAVNVSAIQLLREGLVQCVSEAIKINDIDPAMLEVEITESSLMSDTERAITVLRELKALGVRISLDDFGTGYSSLYYLKQFPLDKLKIDRAFIRDVTTSESDAAIASAIIHMGRSLKLKVIAEGVETREQLDFLRMEDCDEYQGYYFSRPLPAEELDLLQRSHPVGMAQIRSVT